MSVLGETRVMAEMLGDTYDRLVTALKAEPIE